jgi:polysaccharide export outer membrane protein
MFMLRLRFAHWCWALTSAVLLAGGGCRMVPTHSDDKLAPPEGATAVCGTMPRELCKTVLPTYVIEPPDILMIDAVHIVPRSPYSLRTLDMLRIHAEQDLPELPAPKVLIDGIYPVELGGVVNLGTPFGQFRVEGMTVDQARQTVEQEVLRAWKGATL